MLELSAQFRINGKIFRKTCASYRYAIDDTDDDGIDDGWSDGDEVAEGTNPLNPNSYPGADIPTLSEWGMITLLMLLITAGMIMIRRRPEQ